jgi:hypothetical protein
MNSPFVGIRHDPRADRLASAMMDADGSVVMQCDAQFDQVVLDDCGYYGEQFGRRSEDGGSAEYVFELVAFVDAFQGVCL